MKKLRYLILGFSLLSVVACSDVNPFEIENVDFGDPTVGIPLVNSTILVSDFGENPNDNTTVKIDADGKITLNYAGEVLRQDANSIFPPLPYLKYYEIPDTVAPLVLPFSDFFVSKAVFKGGVIRFLFENTTDEKLTVNMTIPEMYENGVVLSRDYVVEPNSTFEGENIPLEGKEILSTIGTMSFNYKAITPSGTRIKLARAAMFIDVIAFSYGEGNFGLKVHNLNEDVINISIFNRWISGGLAFDNPTVQWDIVNSFGLPVRADFKKLELTTIDGDLFQLEGPIIESGLDFAYPTIEEVGQTKTTAFTFDKNNSNLGDLFNQKAAVVTYDVDAITNPDNDNTIIGFFTDTSYFAVNVAVELPLLFTANDLVIADTFEFKKIDYDQLDSTAELHLKVVNAFPLDLSLNMDFLDSEGNALFTLIDAQDWLTVAASPNPELLLEQIEAQKFVIELDPVDLAKIPNVTKVAMKAKITTLDTFGEESIWLYNHHGIDIQLGAVLN